MTLKEYDALKVGDKIRITNFFDKGRIITLGKEYEGLHFKYTSRNTKGFMIGNIFYSYKDAKVLKEE